MSPLMLAAMASVLLPLLFPLVGALPGGGRSMRYGLPLLPLPALALALFTEPGWQLELPYLLTGAVWTMDDLRRLFLLLTATLWTVAGVFAAGYLKPGHLRSFCVFWGLTLAGNLGLTISGDVASFYSFFALMTFAGYGLVIHERNREALRAGRIYLIMALLGEVTLLAGLMMAAATADSMILQELPSAIGGSPQRDIMVGLLLAGFGVKAGLPLLHFWLPLAHPVAPTPASAVLSGAMIKAGLLGWLVVLPFGEAALPSWGLVMVIAGTLASLGAAAIGLCQSQPKAVLAYSSISQMGLMTMIVGVALAEPRRAGILLPVIGLYALHHGLAKGSLFLSAGVSLSANPSHRALAWIMIALPGLSLAGLPFTSGALAKLAMKSGLSPAALNFPVATALAPIMTAGAIATLLLVLRYFWTQSRVANRGHNPPLVLAGWLLATLTSLVLFWWMPWHASSLVEAPVWIPSLEQLWRLLWPMLIALCLTGIALWLGRTGPGIPPGDGIVWLEGLARGITASLAAGPKTGSAGPGVLSGAEPVRWRKIPDCVYPWLQEGEKQLRRSAALVLAMLVLLLAFF
ncbi:complex I subunit 5 family protein [Marinobacter sp.]|uniref:complex I subunit 5 family protein n=1 Tax=Marinobacter sp. TaxID=50741 RepID=UPI00384DAA3D